jgi:D-arabinose 1-dehydrogenase-like Zn-dependent alcohol dehydrogenase
MKIIPKLVAFLEKRVALNRALVSLYTNYYHQVIDNEITLATISVRDRVLNIGCGAIPFTALLIARKTGAKVWAIDCDESAALIARQCVASQQLEHLVTVIHLDGAEEIPFDFDVAVVALQAKPKKEILENLYKSGSVQARIVFRQPRPELAHQYDLLPAQPRFCGCIKQGMATFDKSVLYAGSQ